MSMGYDIEQSSLEKYERLKELLLTKKELAVAFSAGVDSTFLLAAAHKLMGDKVIAITMHMNSATEKDINAAKLFCQKAGITQIVIPFPELDIEGFAENPPDRCYICKKALFTRMQLVAAQNGISCVAEGSNADDSHEIRPGMRALQELGIFSPLMEIGFTKEEIRFLSKEMELPTWDKKSQACLSSRIPYGERITEEKLRAVERSEQLIRDLGFDTVRVRVHGNIARIETDPEDFEKLLRVGIRERIDETLKRFGFTYVTLDLTGYRTGSLNEGIGEKTFER